MAKQFGLGKEERLKSKRQTDRLFAAGKSLTVFPIRATYLFEADPAKGGIQIGVSASKRSFKKAVDRNRIKRLLRESYRLQKQELKNAARQRQLNASVFFIYTGKTILSFEEVTRAMARCLQQLEKRMPLNHESTS